MTQYSRETLKAELDKERKKKQFAEAVRVTLFTLVTVTGIAVLIAAIWLPVLQVYTTTMEPEIKSGDIVVCVKGGMNRGNVIAFYCNNKILVKRVIACEGDEVDISQNGVVSVNGEQIEERYVAKKTLGKTNIHFPYKVEDNRVFVLGDNRENSVDSRNGTIGCIAEENIIGHVLFKVWPLNHFGIVR